MRLMRAGYKILSCVSGLVILKAIELAGRTCYKSESRITKDSATKFCRNLLARRHEAMLEFADITVKFITDRGVSHECVRHRLASLAQESSRFVDYGSKGVTMIVPPWVSLRPGIYGEQPKDVNKVCAKLDRAAGIWFRGRVADAIEYRELRECGWAPQEARSCLPTAMKTELVVKANIREWRHILNLRAADATGKAHPQMHEIMIPLLHDLQKRIPVLFDDIEVPEASTC